MASKSKSQKFDDSLDDIWATWEWLRNLPEYKKDFKAFQKTRAYDAYKKKQWDSPRWNEDPLNLKSRWGFFPLTNPAKNSPQFLSDAFQAIFGHHPLKPIVFLTDLKWIWGIEKTKDGFTDLKGRKHAQLPLLPKYITVEFDPQMAEDSLKNEFGEIVKKIQDTYSIKGKRLRYDSFKIRYITWIGQKFGWTKAEVRRRLGSKESCRKSGAAESWRHRVKRAAKKIAGV